MKYLVCIDDTDMPGTKGTGWLVQGLCEELEKKHMGISSPISRHQLFVHEDIPYTSHNSSMCFELTLEDLAIEPIIAYMADFLETRSERGSDPGLCVAKPDNIHMYVSIGSEKTKTVRMDSKQVVVVLKNEEIEKTGVEYRTITKQEAKQY